MRLLAALLAGGPHPARAWIVAPRVLPDPAAPATLRFRFGPCEGSEAEAAELGAIADAAAGFAAAAAAGDRDTWTEHAEPSTLPSLVLRGKLPLGARAA